MARWEKISKKLKPGHKWTAKPGYNVFVANRGEVRIDYPQDWVIRPGEDAICFYDREPPDDNCTLKLSVAAFPGINLKVIPLPPFLKSVADDDSRNPHTKGEIVHEQRDDVELAWMEVAFKDPVEGREAKSRLCLARRGSVQTFITLDFWADDAPRVCPIWDDLVRSIQMGVEIVDPTKGI